MKLSKLTVNVYQISRLIGHAALTHFPLHAQGYDGVGRSRTRLGLLRRTAQKKAFHVAGHGILFWYLEKLSRARMHVSALVLCVLTTSRETPLCISIRLTRITLMAEKLQNR
jgi:hypothetical protein